MFCSRCGTQNDDSARFCQKCGAATTAAASPPTPAPAPPDPRIRGGNVPVAAGGKRYAEGKNPTIAVVLSLVLAGVGQFYNGDVKKGLVMLAVAIVGGVFTYGLVYVGVAIWSALDAYKVASGKAPLW
ncbi:MAG: zinc ribbon domain-containing protein [Candidatus Rokuibacteriota bacterium]